MGPKNLERPQSTNNNRHNEMIDKDPVREQIEKDARERIRKIECECPDEFHLLDCSVPICFEEFVTGANSQDPIAWNRCLDEVRENSVEFNPFGGEKYLVINKEVFEKLRR